MKKTFLLGIGSLLAVFLTGSVIAAFSITRTTQRLDGLIKLHQVEILREDLIIHIQQVQSLIQRGSMRSSGETDALIARAQEMDRAMNACHECHHSPELTQGLLGMRDMGNDYKAAISRLVAPAVNPPRTSALERRALEIGRELITMTQGMAFTANLRLQQQTQDTLAAIRGIRMILYGTLFCALLLAVLTAYFAARGLEQRLRKLLEATRRISRGELERGVELADAPGSEFRELGDAFNTMIRNLHLSQRHLVQSAKLAAIGEWATNIAYEVNNPLTGVLGHAGLLLKADDIPADRKEQLQIIERETLRARAILKNLLDFSRRKPPRPMKTDISGLVRDTIQLLQGQAGMSNVRIAADCAPGLPQTAVDAGEMKHVFVNLIRNAFFAMPKGGALTISCRHGRDYAGREVVAVEFADTGHGIPEEHLDKIFDPFFTTRPGGEGTGLGLSISFMVVQNHGGRIEVESRVGEGSTFRVILPV